MQRLYRGVGGGGGGGERACGGGGGEGRELSAPAHAMYRVS